MKTRSTSKLIQRLALAGAVLATLTMGSMAQAQPGPRGKGPGAMGRGAMGPGAMGPRGGAHQLIGRHLYPPELVMRFSPEIKLTEPQRKAFIKEIKETQSRATDLKFAMHAEANKLSTLMAAGTVDEKAALAQSDKVMTMERKLKRLHLRLLIRVKNLLTPAQQAALDKIKKKTQPPLAPQ